MWILIHVANVLYLVSYLLKDILWLRVTTVVAGLVLIVYNLTQPAPVWAAFAWGLVFIAINAWQIHVLLQERRPVVLQPDEMTLHRLTFRSLTPRELLKLLAKAKWDTVSEGARIVERGKPLDRLMVIASGRACAEVDAARRVDLPPGCFVGEMSYVTGQAPNADVVVLETSRIVTWKQDELRTLLKDNAELRAAVQMVIGEDLVAKLRPV